MKGEPINRAFDNCMKLLTRDFSDLRNRFLCCCFHEHDPKVCLRLLEPNIRYSKVKNKLHSFITATIFCGVNVQKGLIWNMSGFANKSSILARKENIWIKKRIIFAAVETLRLLVNSQASTTLIKNSSFTKNSVL